LSLFIKSERINKLQEDQQTTVVLPLSISLQKFVSLSENLFQLQSKFINSFKYDTIRDTRVS